MLHDDERGRRGARVGPGRLDHQEALAVGRHVVRAETAGARKVAPLEELRRRAVVPRRTARLHRHAQQRPVGTDVEQFLAAPRPERLPPRRGRDLPLAAGDVRKGPDVDFERPRTVGLVRQPPAVGRDDPVALVELRLQQRRHAARAVERDLQQIAAHRRRPFVEHDRGPIRRDPGDKLVIAARGQPLGGAGAVGRLPPEIVLAAAVRAKDDPPAVRRPHGKPVRARVECHARERRAPQVPDPEVILLIPAEERDARPVG